MNPVDELPVARHDQARGFGTLLDKDTVATRRWESFARSQSSQFDALRAVLPVYRRQMTDDERAPGKTESTVEKSQQSEVSLTSEEQAKPVVSQEWSQGVAIQKVFSELNAYVKGKHVPRLSDQSVVIRYIDRVIQVTSLPEDTVPISSSYRDDLRRVAIDARNKILRESRGNQTIDILKSSTEFYSDEASGDSPGSYEPSNPVIGYLQETMSALPLQHNLAELCQLWLTLIHVGEQIALQAPVELVGESVTADRLQTFFGVLERRIADSLLSQPFDTAPSSEELKIIQEVATWQIQQHVGKVNKDFSLGQSLDSEAVGGSQAARAGLLDNENDELYPAEVESLSQASLWNIILETYDHEKIIKILETQPSISGVEALFLEVTRPGMQLCEEDLRESAAKKNGLREVTFLPDGSRPPGYYRFVPQIISPLQPVDTGAKFSAKQLSREKLLPAVEANRRAIKIVESNSGTFDKEAAQEQHTLLETQVTLRLSLLASEFSFRGLLAIYGDVVRIGELQQQHPDATSTFPHQTLTEGILRLVPQVALRLSDNSTVKSRPAYSYSVGNRSRETNQLQKDYRRFVEEERIARDQLLALSIHFGYLKNGDVTDYSDTRIEEHLRMLTDQSNLNIEVV